MNKYLVPTDFSRHATRAFRFACRMMEAKGGSLTIYNNFTTPLQNSMANLNLKELEEGHLKKLREYSERTLASMKIRKNRIRLDYIVSCGQLEDDILELCEERQFDFIAMGTRGQRAVDESELGSNTQLVIRRVNCPVIAVPLHAKYRPIKKIAYALDYEDFTEVSIKTLQNFADQWNAEIVFLHVNPVENYFSEKKQEMYKKTVNSVESSPNIRFEFVSDEDIVGAIDKFTVDQEIDLLAMYSRKFHFIEAAYKHSVVRKLLFQSRVPLLAFQAS